MKDSLHLVCPNCGAINRVPADRLGAGPTCGKCHQRLFGGQPAAVDAAGFQRHLEHDDIPMLVDFWAQWCGPCKMMAPYYVESAAELEPHMRLLKVDVDAEQAVGARYGIRSIPTLVLFRGGQEVARQAGAMNSAGIVQWARAYGA